MAAVRVFVSFDYDNDQDLKNLLIGQAKYPDSPFEIHDWSVKEESSTWRADALARIKRSAQVAVICGKKTHTATGVSAEIEMANAEGKPYFLLKGRSADGCTKPTAAKSGDKMYTWTWDNLKKLIAGER